MLPIIGDLIQAGSNLAGKFLETRIIKAKGNQEILLAKVQAKIKTIEARAERESTRMAGEFDYDQQVLKNRESSWADEFIIVAIFFIFLAPFVGGIFAAWTGGENVLAQAVNAGWKAHGYDGAPWWFEFAIVGIMVSTLGLFRFFKIWRGMPTNGKASKN